MNQQVTIEELSFSNRKFWLFFFCTQFPQAYDEEKDITIYDLLEGSPEIDYEWSDQFTGYYDGILEESDGYLENPRFLEFEMEKGSRWKIEFHPGDTLYYLDGKEIGCSGPHFFTKKIPFRMASALLSEKNGKQMFLFLLPMCYLLPSEKSEAGERILSVLTLLYPPDIARSLCACILCGLETKEETAE